MTRTGTTAPTAGIDSVAAARPSTAAARRQYAELGGSGSELCHSADKSTTMRRTRAGLLQQLDLVEVHGWDSAHGALLLNYVRATVVRPQLVAQGLSGAVAQQAEASAWAMTWRALVSPLIRTAASPWGVLWSAARRAIADETMAAAYGTAARKAWQHRARQRLDHRLPAAGVARTESTMVSLELLMDLGFDPARVSPESPAERPEAPVLTQVLRLLVDAGWSTESAAAALATIADRVQHVDGRAQVLGGWRTLATQAGIPGWQARRLSQVLLGLPGWPGLIERLAAGDDRDLSGDIGAALRSTLNARLASPETLAREALLEAAS